jgi:hypothetical protein
MTHLRSVRTVNGWIDARWYERSKWSAYMRITPETWADLLAKSAQSKAVEEAQKAEAETQRLKEKAEERVRFASTSLGQTVPVSTWAGRQLKVIVKVIVFRVFAVIPS